MKPEKRVELALNKVGLIPQNIEFLPSNDSVMARFGETTTQLKDYISALSDQLEGVEVSVKTTKNKKRSTTSYSLSFSGEGLRNLTKEEEAEEARRAEEAEMKALAEQLERAKLEAEKKEHKPSNKANTQRSAKQRITPADIFRPFVFRGMTKLVNTYFNREPLKKNEHYTLNFGAKGFKLYIDFATSQVSSDAQLKSFHAFVCNKLNLQMNHDDREVKQHEGKATLSLSSISFYKALQKSQKPKPKSKAPITHGFDAKKAGKQPYLASKAPGQEAKQKHNRYVK